MLANIRDSISSSGWAIARDHSFTRWMERTLCTMWRGMPSSAARVVGGAFVVGGLTKLTQKGRSSVSDTALAVLLPDQFKALLPSIWAGVGVLEILTGAGSIIGRRQAHIIAPIVAAASLGYTVVSAQQAPQRSCGCFGAFSTTPVRASIPRAIALSALSVLGLIGILSSNQKLVRNETIVDKLVPAGLVVGFASLLAALSPERSSLLHRLRTWRLAWQLRHSDAVLQQLMATSAWKVLAPAILPTASPTHWHTDGNHYLEFPANPDSSATTVVFMAYPFENRLRFRGALLREPTGEILLRV